MTFLREAPGRLLGAPPYHETTVHALDALAAATAALTAADVRLDEDLCTDGVDEALVGFWQRRPGAAQRGPLRGSRVRHRRTRGGSRSSPSTR